MRRSILWALHCKGLLFEKLKQYLGRFCGGTQKGLSNSHFISTRLWKPANQGAVGKVDANKVTLPRRYFKCFFLRALDKAVRSKTLSWIKSYVTLHARGKLIIFVDPEFVRRIRAVANKCLSTSLYWLIGTLAVFNTKECSGKTFLVGASFKPKIHSEKMRILPTAPDPTLVGTVPLLLCR